MAPKASTAVATNPVGDIDYQSLIDSAIDISELGIDLVIDKAQLENVPFYVVEWDEKSSEKFANSRYAVIKVAWRDPNGVVRTGVIVGGGGLVDEESNRYGGIVGQLDDCYRKMAAAGATDRPIYVSGGLKASHYTYSDDQGNNIPATTYYLSA